MCAIILHNPSKSAVASYATTDGSAQSAFVGSAKQSVAACTSGSAAEKARMTAILPQARIWGREASEIVSNANASTGIKDFLVVPRNWNPTGILGIPRIYYIKSCKQNLDRILSHVDIFPGDERGFQGLLFHDDGSALGACLQWTNLQLSAWHLLTFDFQHSIIVVVQHRVLRARLQGAEVVLLRSRRLLLSACEPGAFIFRDSAGMDAAKKAAGCDWPPDDDFACIRAP